MIIANKISALKIIASKIGAQVINANPLTQVCRFLSNFDGVTSYAESLTRIIDLDAVDPSFEITQWFDLGQSGTMVSQNVSSSISVREFQIYTFGGELNLVMGGQGVLIIADTSPFAGAGQIKIRYENATGTVYVYKDGLLIAEKTGVVIGASREPTAKFKYMARSNGTVDSEGFFTAGITKNISIVHNALDIYLPMTESSFEGNGTIIYVNSNGNASYNAVGYDIEISEECQDCAGYELNILVGFGASIINRMFESATLNDECKAGYGLGDVQVVNEGVEGNTAADYLARIDSVLANYTGQSGVTFFVHGFGNDVTNTRPYSTATQQEKDDFYDAMLTIINKIHNAGHVCLWSGITYRAYTTNFPDESYGSLPYNTNITYPLILQNLGNAWNTGTNLPYFDYYNILKDNQTWLDVDGIHQTPEGERHLSNYTFAGISQLKDCLIVLPPILGNWIDGDLWIDGDPWID